MDGISANLRPTVAVQAATTAFLVDELRQGAAEPRCSHAAGVGGERAQLPAAHRCARPCCCSSVWWPASPASRHFPPALRKAGGVGDFQGCSS